MPIEWLYSCSEFICRDDTQTVQAPGSLFWCHAVMSLQFTHVRSFAYSLLFYCWSLLFGDDMSTKLLMFISSYDSRRFAACDGWTQTSWKVMQRDETLTADCKQGRRRAGALPLTFQNGVNWAEVSFSYQHHR